MPYVEPEDRVVLWFLFWVVAALAALVFAVGVYKTNQALAAGEYVPGLYRAGPAGAVDLCGRNPELREQVFRALSVGRRLCTEIKVADLRGVRGLLTFSDSPLRGGDLAGLSGATTVTIRTGCEWWGTDPRYARDVLSGLNPAAAVTIWYVPSGEPAGELGGIADNIAAAGFSGQVKLGIGAAPGCPQRRF